MQNLGNNNVYYGVFEYTTECTLEYKHQTRHSDSTSCTNYFYLWTPLKYAREEAHCALGGKGSWPFSFGPDKTQKWEESGLKKFAFFVL